MNKLHRLWRGKRTDTLEWAEFDVEEAVKVSLETLGQCVGFTDRNRKPIFEDDIVIYRGMSGKTCRGKITFSGNKSRFNMELDSCQTFAVERKYSNCYEVIGNIHDDPGLMSGTEKIHAN